MNDELKQGNHALHAARNEHAARRTLAELKTERKASEIGALAEGVAAAIERVPDVMANRAIATEEERAAVPKLAANKPDDWFKSLPVDRLHLVKQFDLTTLEDMTDEHIADPAARVCFANMLATARRWREEVKQRPGLSLILLSDRRGVGKTMIAQAMEHTFCEVVFGWNDDSIIQPEDLALIRNAAFRTSKELMSMAAEHFYIDDRYKLLIIDDIGREGLLRFVKTDEETQRAEVQARYYSIVDHCYRKEISVIITSNMLHDELKQFLNDATWSRLQAMCPKGFMFEAVGLPDYRIIQGGRKEEFVQ